jgi:hypothetical protein
MNDVQRQLEIANSFVAENLTQCCVELVGWERTGVLPDGVLRQAGELYKPLDKFHYLTLAERHIQRLAVGRVATAHP